MTSISGRLARRRGTDNLDLSFDVHAERGRSRRWRQRGLPTQIGRLVERWWWAGSASFGLRRLYLFVSLFSAILDPGEVDHLIVFGFEV